MNTPRKHRDLIIAWANGAKIQYKSKFTDWKDSAHPVWDLNREYRIKPEPIPDTVKTAQVWETATDGLAISGYSQHPNVKFIFDGETGDLKAVELIKPD